MPIHFDFQRLSQKLNLFGRRTRQPRATRLGSRLEHLETRTVMSANITAALDGSTLDITDDTTDTSGEISIHVDSTDPTLLDVTGLNGTYVNSVQNGTFQVSIASISNLYVALYGSNAVEFDGTDFGELTGTATFNFYDNCSDVDSVSLHDLWVGGAVNLNYGQGNDSFTSTDNEFDSCVSLNFGKGDNVVAFSNTSVGYNLDINADTCGWGDNVIALLDGTSVGGTTCINLGKGDNSVLIGGELFSDTIDTYDYGETAQNDFGDININVGDGYNAIMVTNVCAGALNVHTGAGTNLIVIGGDYTFNDPGTPENNSEYSLFGQHVCGGPADFWGCSTIESWGDNSLVDILDTTFHRDTTITLIGCSDNSVVVADTTFKHDTIIIVGGKCSEIDVHDTEFDGFSVLVTIGSNDEIHVCDTSFDDFTLIASIGSINLEVVGALLDDIGNLGEFDFNDLDLQGGCNNSIEVGDSEFNDIAAIGLIGDKSSVTVHDSEFANWAFIVTLGSQDSISVYDAEFNGFTAIGAIPNFLEYFNNSIQTNAIEPNDIFSDDSTKQNSVCVHDVTFNSDALLFVGGSQSTLDVHCSEFQEDLIIGSFGTINTVSLKDLTIYGDAEGWLYGSKANTLTICGTTIYGDANFEVDGKGSVLSIHDSTVYDPSLAVYGDGAVLSIDDSEFYEQTWLYASGKGAVVDVHGSSFYAPLDVSTTGKGTKIYLDCSEFDDVLTVEMAGIGGQLYLTGDTFNDAATFTLNGTGQYVDIENSQFNGVTDFAIAGKGNNVWVQQGAGQTNFADDVSFRYTTATRRAQGGTVHLGNPGHSDSTVNFYEHSLFKGAAVTASRYVHFLTYDPELVLSTFRVKGH